MASDYIRNYSSCYAKIFIGGNEVDSYRVRNIVSLSIAETISGADLCTVVINDTVSVPSRGLLFLIPVPQTLCSCGLKWQNRGSSDFQVILS